MNIWRENEEERAARIRRQTVTRAVDVLEAVAKLIEEENSSEHGYARQLRNLAEELQPAVERDEPYPTVQQEHLRELRRSLKLEDKAMLEVLKNYANPPGQDDA